MSNPKEVAILLGTKAKEMSVRFPKIWDDSKVTQACGSVLMMHRQDGGFNIDAALEALIEKYGQEESTKTSSNKKRKDVSDDVVDLTGDAEVVDSGKKAKKIPLSEIMANEKNRPVAAAIKEMADLCFKTKDMRKGGVFSKAAKAIRESESEITTLKEAMALKGVGKGIATYVVELLETGQIKKLEEMRAGYA